MWEQYREPGRRALFWRNSGIRYGAVAKTFHWLIVVLVFVQIGLGIYGARLPLSMEKLVVLARHKSIGITIFGLMALRLAWRLCNRTPELPSHMRRGERVLAHASHSLLYMLLFALPVTGWLYSSASGISVSWFRLITLPDLVAADKTLAEALHKLHIALASLLAAVVAGHVGAALWHHFGKRDTVLVRMLPGRFKRLERLESTSDAAKSRAKGSLLLLMPFLVLLTVTMPAYGTLSCWTMVPARSKLTFTGEQAGAPVHGTFQQFRVAFCFDPARAVGRMRGIIKIASLETHNGRRDRLLKSQAFFAVARYPRAKYLATEFVRKSGHTYVAKGQLTLRGVTKPVPVRFTFRIDEQGTTATLQGGAVIKRLAFGIGQGEWRSTVWVGNKVEIAFNLVMKRAETSIFGAPS